MALNQNTDEVQGDSRYFVLVYSISLFQRAFLKIADSILRLIIKYKNKNLFG